MWLKQLKLENFRNYHHAQVAFHPQFNFIFGANGQGKTNLLEAIYFLCRLKSFRVSQNEVLVQEGESLAALKGFFENGEAHDEVTLSLVGARRTGKLNGKPIQRVSLHRQKFPCVAFLPFEVYLFRLGPAYRRNFLDEAVGLICPDYDALLADYQKILRQRNQFLKTWAEGTGGDDEWEVWSEKLAGLAAQVVQKRLQVVDKLNGRLDQAYHELALDPRAIALHYVHAVEWGEAPTAEFYLAALKEKRFLEKQRQVTLVGPHRDDLAAILGNKSLAEVGSQGEHRSLVVALKFLLLEAVSGERTPLFLLDDVASELDPERRARLFSYLSRRQAQSFVTTTDHDRTLGLFKERRSVFVVQAGEAKELSDG